MCLAGTAAGGVKLLKTERADPRRSGSHDERRGHRAVGLSPPGPWPQSWVGGVLPQGGDPPLSLEG